MNLRKAVPIVTALVFITVLSSLHAQSSPADSGQVPSESDIFNTGTFDQTVQKSTEQEKKDSLSYLVGGTFLFDSSVTTPTDFGGYTSTGLFAGKLFGKVTVPRYGQLYLSYNLAHTLFAGSGGALSGATGTGGSAAGYTGTGPSTASGDLYSVYYSLSEFFFDFDIAKTLFVRVGNQLLAWGPSNVWTPVDFVNLERSSSLQSIDVRAGKPGVKFFLPFSSADITLFADLANTLNAGAPTDLAKTTNLALRGAAALGGFEFGLSSYLGQSIQNRYGFDFSGRALTVNLYGELAAAFAYGGYDFEYSYSLGFSRAFGELKHWTLQGEFFYNSAGTGDTGSYPAMVAAGTFSPLYVGQVYGYAALSKDQFLADFLKVTLSGLLDASDMSFQSKLRSDFTIPGFVPFSATLGFNGGGAGRALTYFSGNNALTLDLQVLVQF
ncbi:hypothetical protein [Salinispira pacifica]